MTRGAPFQPGHRALSKQVHLYRERACIHAHHPRAAPRPAAPAAAPRRRWQRRAAWTGRARCSCGEAVAAAGWQRRPPPPRSSSRFGPRRSAAAGAGGGGDWRHRTAWGRPPTAMGGTDAHTRASRTRAGRSRGGGCPLQATPTEARLPRKRHRGVWSASTKSGKRQKAEERPSCAAVGSVCVKPMHGTRPGERKHHSIAGPRDHSTAGPDHSSTAAPQHTASSRRWREHPGAPRGTDTSIVAKVDVRCDVLATRQGQQHLRFIFTQAELIQVRKFAASTRPTVRTYSVLHIVCSNSVPRNIGGESYQFSQYTYSPVARPCRERSAHVARKPQTPKRDRRDPDADPERLVPPQPTAGPQAHCRPYLPYTLTRAHQGARPTTPWASLGCRAGTSRPGSPPPGARRKRRCAPPSSNESQWRS